jgi:hypothetical protein
MWRLLKFTDICCRNFFYINIPLKIDFEIKVGASHRNVRERERGFPISVKVAVTETLKLKFLRSGRRGNGTERRQKID